MYIPIDRIMIICSVASAPTITSLEQISTTAVRVEWSQPSGGATVTGYVVHYSDGDTDRNGSVAASSTSYNITDLSWCVTYTISVEATSEHLSRVSESAGMLNALVIVENRNMNEWVHRDAPCKKS